jgi:hypothetical protein
MKSRTNTFVSVLVLMVYGTLAMVSVPFHFHEDSIFATGSGLHEIVQHHDATDCHHHDVGSHDDCTVCSIASHAKITHFSALLRQPKVASVIFAVVSHRTIPHHFLSAISRRGPPSILS